METAKETPIFFGSLLKALRNICFLECALTPPRKLSFPWLFDFSPQGRSEPPRQSEFPVVFGYEVADVV